MISGNPMIRDKKAPDVNRADEWALSFRCWEDDEWLGASNRFAPGAGPYDTNHLPTKPCGGGIRQNIFFPTYVLLRLFVQFRTIADGL